MTIATNETKTCTKCGETKPLGDYSKNGKRKDGSTMFHSACKACSNLLKKRTREKGKANQLLAYLFDLSNQDDTCLSMRYAVYKCNGCHNFHRAAKHHVNDGNTSSCGCFKRKTISKDLSHFQLLADKNASTKGLVVTGKEMRDGCTYVELHCQDHDWTGWQQLSNLSKGNNPCPNCQASGIMASLVALTLRKSGIPFTQEATSNDLLAYRKEIGLADGSSKNCRFDFEVTDWGYAEVDDESHEMDIYGRGLELTQTYDKAKDDFCQINGIRLERITWRQQRWNRKGRRVIERHVGNDIEHDGFIDFETALDTSDHDSCILLITLRQLVYQIQHDLGVQTVCRFPTADEVYDNARKSREKKGLEKYEPDTSGYGGNASIIIDPETGQSAFAESIECVSTGFTQPFGELSDNTAPTVLADVLEPAVQVSLF